MPNPALPEVDVIHGRRAPGMPAGIARSTRRAREVVTVAPHTTVRLRSGVRYGCASQVSSLARMAALTLTQPSRAMCLTWCSS